MGWLRSLLCFHRDRRLEPHSESDLGALPEHNSETPQEENLGSTPKNDRGFQQGNDLGSLPNNGPRRDDDSDLGPPPEKIPPSYKDNTLGSHSKKTRRERQPTFPLLPNFDYEPLQAKDEIRVLRLAPKPKPGPVSRPTPLKASIVHVRLSDSPLYTAVSWMWQTSQNTADIWVNGHMLPIRAHLKRIINDLRDSHQARFLWIDAICINQQSILERNHQVQLMDAIYSKANCVVVCLTEETAHDRVALRAAAQQAHRIFGPTRRSTETILESKFSPAQISHGYFLLFQNRYWRRRWIIQEVIHARSVTLCCEGYQLPLTVFDFMLDQREGFIQEYVNSDALHLCRMRRQMNAGPLPLEQLLYTHRNAECSDPRDRVYALLSLSERTKRCLEVRYDFKPSELLVSVVRVCSRFDGLSAFRTVSYAWFLAQHLVNIGSQIFYVYEGSLRKSVVGTRTIKVRGVVRGTIKSLRVSTEIEEAARQIRRAIPPLVAYSKRHLRPFQRPRRPNVPEAYTLDRPSPDTRSGLSICGIDHFLFSFDGDNKGPLSAYDEEQNTNSIVGLANVAVEPGDQVWQFEQMPLAMIVRRYRDSFTLVGRAYLLRDLSGRSYGAREKLWGTFGDKLVWVRNHKQHDTWTPVLLVNGDDLVTLMCWTGYQGEEE